MKEFHLRLDTLDEAVLGEAVQRARIEGYKFGTLAEADDLTPIYELHQECRKRQPPLETHQEPQDVARWRSIWLQRPDLFFVLRSGEEAVGVCGLHPTKREGEFECGFTGILPAHARRGLTLSLKSYALLEARSKGVRRVVTQVRPENVEMLAINRRLGFRGWAIRPSAPDDLDFLVWVDLEDEGVTPGYRGAWDEEERCAHRAKIASLEALVARDEGRLVGTILWRFRNLSAMERDDFFLQVPRAAFPPNGWFTEIFQLWVAPDYRRLGLATALKRAVETISCVCGAQAIYTHTEEGNEHVLALNERLGYREVRRGPIWDEVVRVSLVKRLEG